jgi:hypothetical protein
VTDPVQLISSDRQERRTLCDPPRIPVLGRVSYDKKRRDALKGHQPGPTHFVGSGVMDDLGFAVSASLLASLTKNENIITQ